MSWTVVDLFSGAGGMSYGFHAHPNFEILAAVDAQIGKPSSGEGSLGCNQTYAHNIGIKPIETNLGKIDVFELVELLRPSLNFDSPSILIACPPCTGFSRTNPENHLRDDPRNHLVNRVALWTQALKPKILFMENARELLKGNFSYHYDTLKKDLIKLGYNVYENIHMLSDFGLPQKRERAIVIAVQNDLQLRTLEDLWHGYKIKEEATFVRKAIGNLRPISAGIKDDNDPMHVSPKLATATTKRRMELIPHDGGSWADIKDHYEANNVLTPAMKRYIAQGKLGSHPDIYGRLWWERPAVTIKRECAHMGNGRYSHPEQDRLCTVREMAILQGFPSTYTFFSTLSNMYRHIGDAVPPLISYQLAFIADWILSGIKPDLDEIILSNTHLQSENIVEDNNIFIQNTFPFLQDEFAVAQNL